MNTSKEPIPRVAGRKENTAQPTSLFPNHMPSSLPRNGANNGDVSPVNAPIFPSVADQFNHYLQMKINKAAIQQYMATMNQPPLPYYFSYPVTMASPAPFLLPPPMPTPQPTYNRLLLPTNLAYANPSPPSLANPTMTVVAKPLFTSSPTPTPSLLTSTDSPSCLLPPSTTYSSSGDAKEDESEVFIDVETIDSRLERKERKKAHVEFYQTMRIIRRRQRMKRNEEEMTCMLCSQKVNNIDSDIIAHVNQHARPGGYACKICGWENEERHKVYEHARKKHKDQMASIEDRRDMMKMCLVLQKCFPKKNRDVSVINVEERRGSNIVLNKNSHLSEVVESSHADQLPPNDLNSNIQPASPLLIDAETDTVIAEPTRECKKEMDMWPVSEGTATLTAVNGAWPCNVVPRKDFEKCIDASLFNQYEVEVRVVEARRMRVVLKRMIANSDNSSSSLRHVHEFDLPEHIDMKTINVKWKDATLTVCAKSCTS